MTATDLLHKSLAAGEYQVRKSFEGLTSDQWHARPIEIQMTAHETAVHLCEVYVAFRKILAGEKHSWGTYELPSEQTSRPLEYAMELRAAAIGELDESADDKLMLAVDFIVLHDAYHVGQMCTLRRLVDSSWDPYSIYAHH